MHSPAELPPLSRDRLLTTNRAGPARPGAWRFMLVAVALLGCRGRSETPDRPAGASAPPAPAESARQAPPPARRTLALLWPAVGDTLVEGRSYVIRWSAPVGMRISLGLATGGKDRGMLLVNAPAEPDSLVWTVPVGFVTGFGVRALDQVRLRLEQADSAGRYVEAGPFTVTGGR